MEDFAETYLVVYKAINKRDNMVVCAIRSKDEHRCFFLIDNLFYQLFCGESTLLHASGNTFYLKYNVNVFHICEFKNQDPQFETHAISRNKDKQGEIMYSSKTSNRSELARELLGLSYLTYIKNK